MCAYAGLTGTICCAPPGVDTVIVKSGRRICGTGGALANAPLVQSKSYFEMKVQSGGELYRQPFCFCLVDFIKASYPPGRSMGGWSSDASSTVGYGTAG